jgi:hypothetical protein
MQCASAGSPAAVEPAALPRPAPDRNGRMLDGWVPVRFELVDGAPAEPSTIRVAVANMRVGDSVPLGKRTLRVVGVRDADQPPVLVVEEA